MKLATFAVVFLAVVVTGKDRALFTYEFSNKLLGEWLGKDMIEPTLVPCSFSNINFNNRNQSQSSVWTSSCFDIVKLSNWVAVLL